jgi:hypothetical protein
LGIQFEKLSTGAGGKGDRFIVGVWVGLRVRSLFSFWNQDRGLCLGLDYFQTQQTFKNINQKSFFEAEEVLGKIWGGQ